MSQLRRALSRPVLCALVLAALIAAAASGCIPQRLPASARFPACSVPVFDATAPASRSALRPYLDEVTQVTGMHFTWVASPADARYGLIIESMPPGTPDRTVGSYQETYHSKGEHGEYVVQGSIIRLRPGASAGIRRHELGHMFGLAHNPGSALMQASPDADATWSRAERSAMRAMAIRSGCTAGASYAPRR